MPCKSGCQRIADGIETNLREIGGYVRNQEKTNSEISHIPHFRAHPLTNHFVFKPFCVHLIIHEHGMAALFVFT